MGLCVYQRFGCEEVSQYLLQRIEEPWMQDLMVACQEIDNDELQAARSGGISSLPLIAPASAAEPAGVEDSGKGELDAECAIKGLQWATGCSEMAVLEKLRRELPIAVLKEQMQLYEASRDTPPPDPEVKKVTCDFRRVQSKDKVSLALHEYCRSCGVDSKGKFPKGFLNDFMKERLTFVGSPLKEASRRIRLWYRAWEKKGAPSHPQQSCERNKRHCSSAVEPSKRQRAAGGQGHPQACPIIREQLYEWWQSMRYSIDWKGLAAQNRSRGRKCLARFPRSVLKAKVLELIEAYCAECLLHGIPAKVFQIRARWWTVWQDEYGVSLRAPNRKYKVPKQVLAERLRLWWITLFRLRALCMVLLGYDPEMENWDQSPFHNNETGAQNVGTIAFKGAREVPLIEAHADTRARWTGNFVTWSNKERIVEEGPPYAEYCFKADGEHLVLKLREHIRSRGYGPWVTVITSPKGSYREADVLGFLDSHLPKMEKGRRWRIIMADDYAAHKSDNVWRLCWERGYVLVIHGGGATPVGQTVDTDLNQHVKRDYMARETVELMSQFRDTDIPVPSVKQTTAMDMMTDVLSNTDLHLKAAEGYKHTGATVDIDGFEDNLICREAGDFWQELGMRAIIDEEVKMVREEATAGRLRWTAKHVRSLIHAYPAHKKVDQVLQNIGDDTILPEGEVPYTEDAEQAANEEESEESGEEADAAVAGESEEEDEEENAQEEEQEGQDEKGSSEEEEGGEGAPRHPAKGEEGGQTSSAGAVRCVDISGVTAAEAEEIERAQTYIDALQQSIAALRAVGALAPCAHLENEIRKEKRRQRNMTKGSAAVAVALVRRREWEAEQDRRRKQLEESATQRTLKLRADAKREADAAKALLQKRKSEIAQLENLLETKQSLKRFAPEHLGQGHPQGRGAAGRKARHEVLDRMARTGVGLSPGQKNDWQWFKAEWDQAMLKEHREEWGGLFASWMQKVLEDDNDGLANVFSIFVYNETTRCFKLQPALKC